MDIEQVSFLNLREHAVDRELVIVFAEAADHIVLMVAGRVFLAQDSDMVVSPVHGRTHQVGRAGVYTDIFLVDMLLMDGSGDQGAVGSQHKAAHLRINGDIIHARGDQDLLVFAADAFSDRVDIIGNAVRGVGDAYAA